MPTSPHTLRLYSQAHSLGDRYYRELTAEHVRGLSSDEQLKELAHAYITALEQLLSHLADAKGQEADSILKKRTQKYLELVKQDLMRYDVGRPRDHAKGQTG
jgi:hypothetical protein